MMKILRNLYNKNYVREFVIEGNDLILIKIKEEPKTCLWNYHYMFRGEKAPLNTSVIIKENGLFPLDIAINPEDDTISYIKFFVVNNQIKTSYVCNDFTYVNDNIKVINEKLDIDHMYMDIEKKFDYIVNNNELLVISSSCGREVTAYNITEDNFILFEGEEFCGILFRNFSKEEKKALEEINILS